MRVDVTTRVITAALAAACVASLTAAGAEGKSGSAAADPGVTASTVTIGGTAPLSGVAAAYASVARGADAYFKYVNARGGVNGRRIVYRYLDDQYLPGLTVQRTRELVQQERVFAIFNSLGTEHNLATREFLNQARVPQVFVGSGARTFGRDYREHPWTIGYLPSYVSEGTIYGRYLGRTRPGARVAVLFQNDDYGRDLIAGLKRGLGRRGRIVAQQGYEVTSPEVASQVARLRSSRAGVLMIFATPVFAIRAYIAVNKLGWRPKIFVNSVASASNTMRIAAASSGRLAEGSISIVFNKDPGDPRWRRDPGMRLYRQIMKRYGTGNASDVYNVYAMSVAHTFVNALKRAGRNLTRARLMNAVTHLDERNNPFLLPGITVRTSPTDRFPIEQARLQRWSNGRWVAFGPLRAARG